jgi:hypothetical protein
MTPEVRLIWTESRGRPHALAYNRQMRHHQLIDTTRKLSSLHSEQQWHSVHVEMRTQSYFMASNSRMGGGGGVSCLILVELYSGEVTKWLWCPGRAVLKPIHTYH